MKEFLVEEWPWIIICWCVICFLSNMRKIERDDIYELR